MKTRAEILGENLKRILKSKNISRKEFAKMMNVTTVAVGAYINAKREPSLDKIFEIADILNVSILELVGENPKVETDKILDSEFQYAIDLLDLTDILAAPAKEENKVNLFIIKSGKITKTEQGIDLRNSEYDIYTTTKKGFVNLIKGVVLMMLSVGNKHFEELIKKTLEKTLEEQQQQ